MKKKKFYQVEAKDAATTKKVVTATKANELRKLALEANVPLTIKQIYFKRRDADGQDMISEKGIKALLALIKCRFGRSIDWSNPKEMLPQPFDLADAFALISKLHDDPQWLNSLPS